MPASLTFEGASAELCAFYSKARSVENELGAFEGKWRQIKGAVKQRWANLTDDDLTFIDGSQDKFLGRLQERYGLTKEQAENQ